ncbi:ABC transporter substrate-binding protein [Yinghuangia seranimata]|uniref:ABC transporter substrate-binding protein n=1 Tax=Yinghuangia seranimata TaxID=408067 RepID=UPI00248CC050|nr:ABC transporter substrate-binding protein [Yinghuangia seranimata]MDI2129771.1 ABC transporter substrate-binding protein [Yinghuangia seranimata]
MSRQARTAVTLAAVLALAATACSGSGGKKSAKPTAAPPAQSAVASAQPPAKSGGTLRMLAVQDSAQLDPFRTAYVAVTDEPRLSALYDPMFVIQPATGKVVPHLGESITTSDGGRTWTLKLRPGVTFSDGTPFDAEAVKKNWEMHADPATNSLHRAAATGLTLNVVDPLTLSVTPQGPNANFDRTIAQELPYIESPQQLAKGPDAYGSQPVGAGPFVLTSWTRGNEQVFTKNPTYWQKDKGLPKLDGFSVKNVPDIQQQLAAVKSGQADIFTSSDPALLDRGAKDANAAVLKVDGGQYFLFNMTRPPFDDPRARRAVSLAMDPADIPKTLNNGYIPAKGVFSSSSPWLDPNFVQPPPNRAEAQRLFTELAGEGKKVDFTYLIPQNPSSQKTAEYMQSRLTSYTDVSMRIESLEIGAYIVKSAIQHDFQGLLTQRWVPDPEPQYFLAFYSKSPLNYGGWNNPAADRALIAGRSSADPAARKQAYSDLQQAMMQDLPLWVYSEAVVGPIYNSKVTGVEVYNAGVLYMDRIGFK